jgi:hypothetical protein
MAVIVVQLNARMDRRVVKVARPGTSATVIATGSNADLLLKPGAVHASKWDPKKSFIKYQHGQGRACPRNILQCSAILFLMSQNPIDQNHERLNLLLWTLPILLAMGLIVLMFKPARKSWVEEGRQPSLPAQKVLELWESTAFIPVERSSDFEASLESISTSFVNMPPSAFKNIMREEALEMVKDFLYALRYKDADAFLRFRLPVSTFKVETDLLTYRHTQLKNEFPEQQAVLSAKPEDVARNWFMAAFVPRNTNGVRMPDKQLSQAVEGISIAASAFYFEQTTTIPEPLNVFVTKEPNNGYVETRSFVAFSPNPASMLVEHGYLNVLTTRLHLQPVQDPPMPIFFRFYWDEGRQKWLPWEHAIPLTEGHRQNYAF